MKKILKKSLIIFALSLLFINSTLLRVNASKDDKGFWIKFIDVGQGDAALISCDGKYMLIDGGPSNASSTIYTILKENGIDKIDVMIATHPDADHIGGLSGALSYAKVKKCYCSVTKHDTETFNDLVKYLDKQDVSIKVPKKGDDFKLGSSKVTILGPIKKAEDTNNNSIVVRIEYGKNSFLFMGDAEKDEEEQIIDKFNKIDSDVIKVGHHGSGSSTTKELLDEVNPKYAVISVGKGNNYGHPVQDTLDKLKDSNVEIYRTDLQGDITVTSDGKEISISTEKTASKTELETKEKVEIPKGTTFVLNTASKRFHNTDCKGVNDIQEANREFSTNTAEELVEQGYKPCGTCNPSDTVSNTNASDNKKDASSSYVLNTRSKKFHLMTCDSVSDMKQKNRKDVFLTRDEIISDGYSPCKRCNP